MDWVTIKSSTHQAPSQAMNKITLKFYSKIHENPRAPRTFHIVDPGEEAEPPLSRTFLMIDRDG